MVEKALIEENLEEFKCQGTCQRGHERDHQEKGQLQEDKSVSWSSCLSIPDYTPRESNDASYHMFLRISKFLGFYVTLFSGWVYDPMNH